MSRWPDVTAFAVPAREFYYLVMRFVPNLRLKNSCNSCEFVAQPL